MSLCRALLQGMYVGVRIEIIVYEFFDQTVRDAGQFLFNFVWNGTAKVNGAERNSLETVPFPYVKEPLITIQIFSKTACAYDSV